ncbi:MAG TPA: lyase family protein [Pyrinomonadaceae bacterium]
MNPNDHVNKSQSTNDVMPTAMRIACIRGLRPLVGALDELEMSFAKKAGEFKNVQKSGRTHLHDAVPMTLGDEFQAYAQNVHRVTTRLSSVEDSLLEVPLGGTAVGTGTTERSVGVAALYNKERGFMGAAELAQKAIETGKSVEEVVAEE